MISPLTRRIDPYEAEGDGDGEGDDAGVDEGAGVGSAADSEIVLNEPKRDGSVFGLTTKKVVTSAPSSTETVTHVM